MNSEYLAGFFDGEGSFQITLRDDPRYKTGVQVRLRIDITQRNRRPLDLIREFVGAGKMYFNRTYQLYQYNIFKIEDIEKFIATIDGLLVVKARELELFSECVEIVRKKEHLKTDGLQRIREIKSTFRSRN